jgi:hypothetical protein
VQIHLTEEDRRRLDARARQRTAPHIEVLRARALLMAADGKPRSEVAKAVGVDPSKVSHWKRDFLQRGIDALKDRKRSGRPRRFSPLSSSCCCALRLSETGSPDLRTAVRTAVLRESPDEHGANPVS